MGLIDSIISFDEAVWQAIIGLTAYPSTFLHWAFWTISASVIIALAAALLYYFRKKKSLVCLKLVLGSAVTFIAASLVKLLVPRFRPDFSLGAFPSRHVALAAFLAFLLPVKRRTKALLFVWIGIVALSRLWLGRHWLSDVIFGGLIGVLTAIAVKKYKPKMRTKGSQSENQRFSKFKKRKKKIF